MPREIAKLTPQQAAHLAHLLHRVVVSRGEAQVKQAINDLERRIVKIAASWKAQITRLKNTVPRWGNSIDCEEAEGRVRQLLSVIDLYLRTDPSPVAEGEELYGTDFDTNSAETEFTILTDLSGTPRFGFHRGN
jgi:hypothetical protein